MQYICDAAVLGMEQVTHLRKRHSGVESLRIVLVTSLTLLHEERAKFMFLNRVLHGSLLGFEYTKYLLVLDHDKFAGMLCDKLSLMRQIVLELGLEGDDGHTR